MTTSLTITHLTRDWVQVTDPITNTTRRVHLATYSAPWALDPNQPFPDDYADYTPLGTCALHGLEPHQAPYREVSTGAGDTCIAALFTCGALDPDTIF